MLTRRQFRLLKVARIIIAIVVAFPAGRWIETHIKSSAAQWVLEFIGGGLALTFMNGKYLTYEHYRKGQPWVSS